MEDDKVTFNLLQFILLNVGYQHRNPFFLFNLKVTFYVDIGMHFFTRLNKYISNLSRVFGLRS